MRGVGIIALMHVLSSCSQLVPGLVQAVDDAVTDEAVCVTVDKAAMQKDTSVKINVDITNNK